MFVGWCWEFYFGCFVDVELVEQCRISVMALVVVLGLWHRLLWVNMDLLVFWDQVG